MPFTAKIISHLLFCASAEWRKSHTLCADEMKLQHPYQKQSIPRSGVLFLSDLLCLWVFQRKCKFRHLIVVCYWWLDQIALVQYRIDRASSTLSREISFFNENNLRHIFSSWFVFPPYVNFWSTVHCRLLADKNSCILWKSNLRDGFSSNKKFKQITWKIYHNMEFKQVQNDCRKKFIDKNIIVFWY